MPAGPVSHVSASRAQNLEAAFSDEDSSLHAQESGSEATGVAAAEQPLAVPLSAEPQPDGLAPAEAVPAEGFGPEPADPALGETAPMIWDPYFCKSSDTVVATHLCLPAPRLRHE